MPCHLSLSISDTITAFVLAENKAEKCFASVIEKEEKIRKKKEKKEKKERKQQEEENERMQEASIDFDRSQPSTSAAAMQELHPKQVAFSDDACVVDISSSSSSSNSSDNETGPAARKKMRPIRPFGEIVIAETSQLGTGYILHKEFRLKSRSQFFDFFTCLQRYKRKRVVELVHEGSTKGELKVAIKMRQQRIMYFAPICVFQKKSYSLKFDELDGATKEDKGLILYPIFASEKGPIRLQPKEIRSLLNNFDLFNDIVDNGLDPSPCQCQNSALNIILPCLGRSTSSNQQDDTDLE